jgi:hypothetical protein
MDLPFRFLRPLQQAGVKLRRRDDGVNNPFAQAFVAELKVPGREVRRLFHYLRWDQG